MAHRLFLLACSVQLFSLYSEISPLNIFPPKNLPTVGIFSSGRDASQKTTSKPLPGLYLGNLMTELDSLKQEINALKVKSSWLEAEIRRLANAQAATSDEELQADMVITHCRMHGLDLAKYLKEKARQAKIKR